VPYQDCEPRTVQDCKTYTEQVCRNIIVPRLRRVCQYEADGDEYDCKPKLDFEITPYCELKPRRACTKRTTQDCTQKYREECEETKQTCQPRQECRDEQHQVCDNVAAAPVCETRKTPRACASGETWTTAGCVPQYGQSDSKGPQGGESRLEDTSWHVDRLPEIVAGFIGAFAAVVGGLFLLTLRRRSRSSDEMRRAGVAVSGRADPGNQYVSTGSNPATGSTVTIRSVAGPLRSAISKR
jgi:hypothetical protein